MPVLNPPIARIYTPPTCTLEVMAQPSALSRWSRNPAIKSLDFTLNFEGLTRNVREAIALRGNQTQLMALSEAVTAYVQDLLAARYQDLPLSTRAEAADANVSSAAAPEASAHTDPETMIALRPQSLLTHELVLGPLATEFSGPTVVLKVSQLFDLATALEDCAADLQPLPDLGTGSPLIRPALLPLLRSAALVLLTVGLGTATWRMMQPSFLAVKPSSPTTETAMAPPTPAPASKALPVPPPRPTGTLKLPVVQLPSRNNPSFPATADLGKTQSPAADLFAEGSGPSSQSSAPVLQIPPEPSAPVVPPEVAQAPILETRSSADSAPANSAAKMGKTTTNTTGSTFDAPSAELSQQVLRAAPQKNAITADREGLFDTTPQVAEVRSYIASHWQATELPSKTLEYRLTLNANGSLANVEPFGALAQRYLDKLPLPAAPAPFVSTVGNGNTVIRLVVRPNGSVQTFLDSSSP